MDEHEYLTKEKHKALSEELQYLKKTKRKEVAEQLEYAKSLGDLSENAEYQEARDTQAMIEDRIAHLESILKTSKVVSSHATNTVAVGSVVSIKKDGSGGEKIYTIVGIEESDINANKISTESPLGQAIFGKKKGETFSFKTPSGLSTYKVISIK